MEWESRKGQQAEKARIDSRKSAMRYIIDNNNTNDNK